MSSIKGQEYDVGMVFIQYVIRNVFLRGYDILGKDRVRFHAWI